MTKPEPGWWAVLLHEASHATVPTLSVYIEDGQGGQTRTEITEPPADVPAGEMLAWADAELERRGWQRTEGWERMSEEGHTAQVAPSAPPKRGRGRPRTVGRRIPIGFPADVIDDLEQAARERGSTLTHEVIRRCRAAGSSG